MNLYQFPVMDVQFPLPGNVGPLSDGDVITCTITNTLFECPPGEILVGEECVDDGCPLGEILVGEECVPVICDEGFELEGDVCVPIICEDGFELVGNECVEEPDNDGGDNAWATRPTFGVNHETLEDIVVDSGFRFNDNSFTVTDNHHTAFDEQIVELGALNTFAATVYADKDLKNPRIPIWCSRSWHGSLGRNESRGMV